MSLYEKLKESCISNPGDRSALERVYDANFKAVQEGDFPVLGMAALDRDPISLGIVEFLLDKGVDPLVMCEEGNGWTAFHHAIANDEKEKIQLLLERTPFELPQKTRDGYTLLHFAALVGNIEVVRVLIPRVGLNQRDHEGKTALHLTLQFTEKKMEMVKCLIEEGIDLSLKSHAGETALDVAQRILLLPKDSDVRGYVTAAYSVMAEKEALSLITDAKAVHEKSIISKSKGSHWI